jgi:predicted lipoprotein with Yx(FWY)xxD motif
MRPTLKILLPSLAISVALAACGSSSKSAPSSTRASTAAPTAATTSAAATAQAVKTASNAALGATVLVDAEGKTLYHLSGERSGRFLCTSAACVANWPPVSASATSSSVGGLETVKRPEGSEQLAYKGEPLYTFAGDKAAGEANGQGIKDGGHTWEALIPGASAASATTTKSSSESEGAGGYGY